MAGPYLRKCFMWGPFKKNCLVIISKKKNSKHAYFEKTQAGAKLTSYLF